MNEYKFVSITQVNNNIRLYPILLGGGTDIGPCWFPLPPIPSLASAKVSCQGANTLEKHIVADFLCFKRKT